MNHFGLRALRFRLFASGIGSDSRRCCLGFFRLGGFRYSLRLRQSAGARVNALVNCTATQRIRAFNKHALDEFVVKQSLAIHELVQHPRGNLLRLGLSPLNLSLSRWTSE